MTPGESCAARARPRCPGPAAPCGQPLASLDPQPRTDRSKRNVDWSATLHGLAGGILIGLSATWLMATLGRIAGISGIIGSLITARPRGDSAWRLTFLLGLVSEIGRAHV